MTRVTPLPHESEAPTPRLRRRVFHRLADGRLVLLRPVTRHDRELLRRGFEALSPQSRYRRFFHYLDRLSEAELRRLLDLDDRDRAAWGAIDMATGHGIGLARYARDPSRPERAEVAVTVADGWQGKGIGRLVMTQLIATARASGIAVLTGEILAENTGALRLFEKLGARLHRPEGGVVAFEIDLSHPPLGSG